MSFNASCQLSHESSAIKAELSEDICMFECINKDKQVLKIWKSSSDYSGDKFISARTFVLVIGHQNDLFLWFLMVLFFLLFKSNLCHYRKFVEEFFCWLMGAVLDRKQSFPRLQHFCYKSQSEMSASVQLKIYQLFGWTWNVFSPIIFNKATTAVLRCSVFNVDNCCGSGESYPFLHSFLILHWS